MPTLIDEPITAETTPAGRLTAITWRGNRYPARVLTVWEARVYRVATMTHDGPAIGEIARRGDCWRLRYWWT